MAESLGVSVVILQGESVLLILREDFRVWGLPGGQVEAGESVAEAAIREAREETGLEVGLDRIVGIYYNPLGHQVLFLAHVCSGEARPDGCETLNAKWFAVNDLPGQLIGWHRLYIQDALDHSPSVVRRIEISSMPQLTRLSQLTRQELYDLKNQGKLNLKAFLAELCAPVEEKDTRNLVG